MLENHVETATPNAEVRGTEGPRVHDEKAAKRLELLRNRIACDLLLARLFKHHPEEAGITYCVKDIEGPIEPRPIVVREAPKVQYTAHIEPLPTDKVLEQAIGQRVPPVRMVLEVVARFYELSMPEFLSKSRVREYTIPRQVAMYLCRKLTARSLPDIGRRMGGIDHTSVLHGARKIAAMVSVEGRVKDEVQLIELRIREALLNAA